MAPAAPPPLSPGLEESAAAATATAAAAHEGSVTAQHSRRQQLLLSLSPTDIRKPPDVRRTRPQEASVRVQTLTRPLLGAVVVRGRHGARPPPRELRVSTGDRLRRNRSARVAQHQKLRRVYAHRPWRLLIIGDLTSADKPPRRQQKEMVSHRRQTARLCRGWPRAHTWPTVRRERMVFLAEDAGARIWSRTARWCAHRKVVFGVNESTLSLQLDDAGPPGTPWCPQPHQYMELEVSLP
jgi:hypothetical protein